MQRDETLERKANQLRKKGVRPRKSNELDRQKAKIDEIIAEQLAELERISGLSSGSKADALGQH